MSRQTDPVAGSARRRPFRLFVPILAGATLRDRVVGCIGALLGICLTGLICGRFLDHTTAMPLIIAPIGASAVLLFAVPASPLAQPWSIIGGNTLSALVGLTVVHVLPEPALAIGIAVASAIAVMSFTRCLHPPGGAVALTAVLGGPAATGSAILGPVILNSLILVVLGVMFHKASRHRYPHVAAPVPVNRHRTDDPPSERRTGFNDADIDAALAALDEAFDVDRGDLSRLMRQVEHEALMRTHGAWSCRDVMSRDVVAIGLDDDVATARALLLDHNIRTLPVIGRGGSLMGTIGLRELADTAGDIGHVMSDAATAAPGDPAVGLIPILSDGRTHAVIVVDEGRRVQGVITQTDLLAALARTLPVNTVSYRAAS